MENELINHIYAVNGSKIIFNCFELRKNYPDEWRIVGVDATGNEALYSPNELTDLGEAYDFITAYYPNFDHADEIAWEDDLYCVLTGDCDDDKEQRIKSEWGNSMEDLKKIYNEMYREIIERSIKEYRLKHE